jgi:hypothetical protein
MTNLNQTVLQQQLIDELQDLAKSQAGEKLTDFTLYALGIPEVAQNVSPETISKIYRLKGLLEEAKQLE